jgi:C-terminal processing protease CtpA/Prc
MNTTPADSTSTVSRAYKMMRLATLMAACTLTACGGGGGSAGDSPFGGSTPSPAPSSLAQQCSPNNPYRADATQSTQTGSLTVEKSWVRSYMNAAYLWYDEVPSVNATAAQYSVDTIDGFYDSIDGYFNALRTPALTASNQRRDRFSFTYPTRAWNDLAQSGVRLGYGIEWSMQSPTPPRNIRIAYVEPGSAAANAGLLRGDTLVSVNGVSADDGSQAGVDVLNSALFPSSAGTFSFVFSRTGSANLNRNLTAASVNMTPVPSTQVLTVAGGQKVGYILFNDHIAPAEQQLINAINTLRSQGITDLVLDLRYNGGGYIFIASELAYMIAGPSRTASKVFEKFQYNNKRTTENAQAGTPFFDTSCGLVGSRCTNVQPLPTLNLSRVYVLTSGGTCSASESIVNGLRGIDVEVHVVGTTTCGKPYGFTAKDNCGISYFPIEFKGVNAKGFGDYADGFSATCTAGDDFGHALGDVNEAKLATALYMRANGNACPPVPLGLGKEALAAAKQGQPVSDGTVLRGPQRENRIHLPLQR